MSGPDAAEGESPSGPVSTPSVAWRPVSVPGIPASGPPAPGPARTSSRGISPLTRRRVGDGWAPPAALIGVLLSVVVAVTAGAQAGSFVLSGLLLLAAVVRALDPGDGPAGVAVRSKTFDVSLLSAMAAVIAVLAATASGV